MNTKAQTYGDARLDVISRSVYFKALTQIEKILDTGEGSSERLQALAEVAQASSNLVKDPQDD